MDQTQVRNSQNETVIVEWKGQGDQYFNLNCNFVPDLIKVQIAIFNAGQDFSGEILSAYSNLFGRDVLAICNAENTYNPTYEYWNSSRQNISGSYSIRLQSEFNQQTLTLDTFCVLKFQYIRFKDA